MRLLVTTAAATVLALGILAAGASGSGFVRYGIQDDAWLTHGPGTLAARLDRVDRLGVDLVRFNLHWNRIEPTQGSPDWKESDAVLKGLRKRGIKALVGLVGSPELGQRRARAQLRAARGRLRRVRRRRRLALPLGARLAGLERAQPGALAAADVARRLRPLAAQPGLRGDPRRHAEGPRGRRRHRAPRRLERRLARPWIRGMKKARARLDAYAHHPYPARPTDTPFAGGCGHSACRTITMATLERLLDETRRAFGAKRIWLTEYAYQTGRFGVTQQRQAELIGQSALRVARAPRVDILIHYLVQDEPEDARFQSGLFRYDGVAKLAASAFPFPLAHAGRSGGKAVLWGQIRPRSGRQTFRVQVRTDGRWSWSGPNRRTSARGFLSVAVPAPRGTLVRVWSPRDRAYSAAVLLR